MTSETIEEFKILSKNDENFETNLILMKKIISDAFGISLNEHLAVEFADCPDVIPDIQNSIENMQFDHFVNKINLSLFLDDLLQKILMMLRKSLVVSTENVDDDKLNDLFCNCLSFSYVKKTKSYLVINYLNNAKNRCSTLLSNRVCNQEESNLLSICQKRIELCTILFLRGLTHAGVSFDEIVNTEVNLLIKNQFDFSALFEKICLYTENGLIDNLSLSEVFNPIFTKLRHCIVILNLSDQLNPLTEILFKRIFFLLTFQHAGKRPLADLVVSRDDFCPNKEKIEGREFVKLSFLGPIFAPSTTGDDDKENIINIHAANKFFTSEDIFNIYKKENLYSKYQSAVNSLRVQMHSIVHILLVNANTRSQTLYYLSQFLMLNKKRTQIHAAQEKLVSSGVMLNFLSVMLQLSERLSVDKIQDNYVFHPKNPISCKNEPKISFSHEEIELYSKEIDTFYCPKFITECFYLTIYALHIGLNPSIELLKKIKVHMQEIKDAINDLLKLVDKKGKGYGKNSLVLNQINHAKELENILITNNLCLECMLQDENLIMSVLLFIRKQLTYLTRTISPDFVNNTLPNKPPISFGALPELFVESALDFIAYLERNDLKFFIVNSAGFAEPLLVLCCCLQFFKNPYLASKIVNVIFYVSPLLSPISEVFFNKIVDNPFAGQLLFASLSRFYADVESTGATTEFDDKLNIRRSIQMIFKSMWQFLIHRNSIVDVASKNTAEFIRFINMVLNDATFLLDESLNGLKKIRDLENLMANETEFNSLSEEDRNLKRGALTEVKRTVKTWMILCNDTMEFLKFLTTDNPQVFYNTLGDRIAAMLNYNLVQLCGPKCTELKVKDAKVRFQWDPRELLELIVVVYLNLSSETFAENIAQDERSYTSETFAAILEKMKNKRILEISHIERLKNLLEMAERYYKAKEQEEMDLGDDIPDEFRDELVYTLMSEPMRLPSGQVVDKKHILRHLLSNKTNPFTRQPLTVEELVPDVALKERIESWIKEKKNNNS